MASQLQGRRGFIGGLALLAGGAAAAVVHRVAAGPQGSPYQTPAQPAPAQPVALRAGVRRANMSPVEIPSVRL